MKDTPRFDFKEAWVIAAVSVLVVYFIGQLKPDSELGRVATEDWLLAWMILLSLPASLVFILFVALLYVIMGGGIADDWLRGVLLWLGFFAAGYLQWCKIVPHLFEREQMIKLNLERGEEVSFGRRGHRGLFDFDPAAEREQVFAEDLKAETERACDERGAADDLPRR